MSFRSKNHVYARFSGCVSGLTLMIALTACKPDTVVAVAEATRNQAWKTLLEESRSAHLGL